MNIDRKNKIDEWKAKGLEWCTTQLWNAKQEIKKDANYIENLQRKLRDCEADCEKSYFIVKNANDNLMQILKDYGIRPTRLTVTFEEKNCEHCNKDRYQCEEESVYYWEDICDNKVRFVKEISFYVYEIADDYLSGINALFEDVEYDLLKVVNSSTGEVLYEYKEEDE